MRLIQCAMACAFCVQGFAVTPSVISGTTATKAPENAITIAERQAKREARYLHHIYDQTKRATAHGYNVNGVHVTLDPAVIKSMQKGTKVSYNPKPIPHGQDFFKTQIVVSSRDQVTAGATYLAKGFTTVLLNTAHRRDPGDNVWGGKLNMEANFFRVSDYFKSLLPWQNKTLKKQLKGGKYEVPTYGVIYSPNVFVFRDTQSRNFLFLATPLQFNFVASTPFSIHQVGHEKFRRGMKQKIRAIFRSAWAGGNQVVVLSDYEVYQHHNNPKQVASLFREVLEEDEFKGVFATVDFAIAVSPDTKLFISFSRQLDGLKQ